MKFIKEFVKIRESGMPDMTFWESSFNVPLILERMQIRFSGADIAEFGSGYGTLTLAAARQIQGKIHALEIDPPMGAF